MYGSCDVLVLVNAGSKDLKDMGVLLAVLSIEVVVDIRLDVGLRKGGTLDGDEEKSELGESCLDWILALINPLVLQIDSATAEDILENASWRKAKAVVVVVK